MNRVYVPGGTSPSWKRPAEPGDGPEARARGARPRRRRRPLRCCVQDMTRDVGRLQPPHQEADLRVAVLRHDHLAPETVPIEEVGRCRDRRARRRRAGAVPAIVVGVELKAPRRCSLLLVPGQRDVGVGQRHAALTVADPAGDHARIRRTVLEETTRDLERERRGRGQIDVERIPCLDADLARAGGDPQLPKFRWKNRSV